MGNSVRLPILFPDKLQFLFRPMRYKVTRGGRGGAKSWGIARALLIEAIQKKLLCLCTREYQNSIAESVHRLLSEQIERLGFGPWFEITSQSIVCKLTGSEFIFAGLHNNITKIKSMEGIDRCWIEEAEKVSKKSWSVLIPTIRKSGSEIWVSFNPDEEADPTYQMFVVNPPPDSVVMEIGWQDNPWFPEELRKEKDYAYKVDPESAEHVWGGKCIQRSDAQIFAGKYVVQAFEPEPTWDGPYFGQDFGFSTDPAATSKTWINELMGPDKLPDRTLYIEYVVFGHGLKNDELNKLIRTIPGADKHIIRADNARPETIAHLSEDFGLQMVSCKKWAGCVEDGIQYLRSFDRIVIHPRNKGMIDEARLYRYKVDRITGDVLPVIVDAYNHGWDSIRYGQEPAIVRLREEIVVVDGAPDLQISPDLDEAEFSTW